MTEIKEGTIGVVWVRDRAVHEISVHEYRRRPEGHLTWGSAAGMYRPGTQAYEKLSSVLSLMHDPQLGAEAFYFTPEEYQAIMEGL